MELDLMLLMFRNTVRDAWLAYTATTQSDTLNSRAAFCFRAEIVRW